jgi:murein hydrolase activator
MALGVSFFVQTAFLGIFLGFLLGLQRPALMQSATFRVLAPLSRWPGPALLAALGGLAFGLAFGPATAAAQAPARQPGEIPYLPFPPVNPAAPAKPAGRPAPNPQVDLEALKKGGQDLEAVRAEQKKAIETEARLRREIESIGEDRRQLNQHLIDTAARIRAAETEVAGAQERLQPLDTREQALRQSLEDRRSVMAEVLAALQRIGRHPPPALMVTAQDALQSLRSAMMLGAVLPEMRHEADLLITDLAELTRIRAQIAGERDGLARDLMALSLEHQRLGLLTDQRQKQQAESEQALEQGLGPACRPENKAAEGRPDFAALNDPGRLAPAIAFATAKGRLPLPVNGVRIKEFGAPDGLGGTEKGLTVAARPGAQITAPCDGWVVYAGPFRNYGQLLILNAGNGYHVLLAGMDRISVDLGQFVVTGEPVAVMGGGGSQVPAALAANSGQPVLYVEFRKDGTPVDPSPWWATNDGEKVRG